MTRFPRLTSSQDVGQTETPGPYMSKHDDTARPDRKHATAPCQIEHLLRYVGGASKRIFRIAKGVRDIVSGNL